MNRWPAWVHEVLRDASQVVCGQRQEDGPRGNALAEPVRHRFHVRGMTHDGMDSNSSITLEAVCGMRARRL